MDETGAYKNRVKQVRKRNNSTVYQCIYMEFRKTVMTILYARPKRDTDVKNRLLDYVGEGEGGIL